MQDCKDESGLQFINFDFVTGDQEKNQIAIAVEFSIGFFAVILSFQLTYLSLLSLLAIFSSQYINRDSVPLMFFESKLKYFNDFRSCDR